MKNYSSTGRKQILIAPNAFKGSLEATEFCHILQDELADPLRDIYSFPMCDGGDGTASILASYLGAIPHPVSTLDALGRARTACYYTTGDTAIVDLADICGLKALSPSEYDVLNANTRGLGIVLKTAANTGIRKFIVGVGGSASIDGGCGALREMGLILAKDDEERHNDLIGLKLIDDAELKQYFKDIEFTVLCDVENPLCGPQGAAQTFGPQKGATPSEIALLDEQLAKYAHLLASRTGKDILSIKHGGAAGGIAAAFAVLLNARLVSGADFCLQVSGLKDHLPHSQLVITGEGKIDDQTMQGKLPGVIAGLCRAQSIPVIAIAGSADPLPLFDRIYALIDYAENLPAAIRHPGYYLRMIARDLARTI